MIGSSQLVWKSVCPRAIALFLLLICGSVAHAANQPPTTGFTYTPSSPGPGQAITFTNTSTDPDGDLMQFWWTFGDGQTSSAGSPTISYAAAGTYTVELSATDNVNGWTAVSQTIVVGTAVQSTAPVVSVASATASRPAGSAATATFSVRNDNGAARTYALVATSSNTAVVADPADPAQITVSAKSAANVTVSYQVSASAAAGSTAVLTLQATDTGDTTKKHSASFTHTTEAAKTNQPPTAAFTYAPSSPGPGQAITFTNTSTDPDGDPMQFWWTFGDGQTSSAASPTISYAAAGTYTVELSATDNVNGWTAVSQTIVVGTAVQIAAPVVSVASATASRPAGSAATATFSVRNDNGAARTYALVATSSNTAVVADPADPAQITVAANSTANVTVSYQVSASAAAGSTAVLTLQATDTGDTTKRHSASFTHTTEAAKTNQPPTAAFTYAPSSPVPGQAITFTNTSTDPDGDQMQFWWTFGDGQTSAAGSPTISYAARGTYTVELSATDNVNGWTASSQTVVVGDAVQTTAPVVSVASATGSHPAGSAATATFSVRNDNGAARTYALVATSSNTAVVADPADPAQITVSAKSAANVTVSYQVSASAAAGSTSVLTLQATDTGDTTKKHSASFTHTTAPHAPATLVLNGWRTDVRGTSHQYPVKVTNPSGTTRSFCLKAWRAAGITPNMNDVTTGEPTITPVTTGGLPCQSFAGGQTKEFLLGYTMAQSTWDGADILVFVQAYDQADASIISPEQTFKITVQTDVAPPAGETLYEGQTYTRGFRVYNKNPWGQTYTYTASATGDAVLTNVSVPSASLAIPAGGSAVFDVQFTVAAGSAGKSGTLTLTVNDAAHAPRFGTASVEFASGGKPGTPALTILHGSAYGLRGNTYSRKAEVTNASTFARNLCIRVSRQAGISGDANNVTTADPTVAPAPCQSVGAGLKATFTLTHTVTPAAPVDGDAVIVHVEAYDSADAAAKSSSSYKVIVETAVTAPPSENVKEGAVYKRAFRLYNQNPWGSDITYNIPQPTTTAALTVLNYTPQVIARAAEWTDIWVEFKVNSGYCCASASIRIDPADADPLSERRGTGHAVFTVALPNQAPVLSSLHVPASGSTAAAVTFSATATDADNDPLTYTWNFGDQHTAVGASVTHTYASVGTYTVTVTVSDGTTAVGGSASISISAAAPSHKFTAYSIYRSNYDYPLGIPIHLGANILDAREYRQWVGWQSCTPNYYANGDPLIQYTHGVPEFAAANPGRMYIFLDEPGMGTFWTPGGCLQVTPAQYARAYKAFVDLVRKADPTARFSPAYINQIQGHPDAYPKFFVDYAAEFESSYIAQFGTPPPVAEWRFLVYWEWGQDNFADTAAWQAKTDQALAFGRQRNTPVAIGIGYPWEGPFRSDMLQGMTNMFNFLKDQPLLATAMWWSYDEWNAGDVGNRLTTLNGEPAGPERTLTELGIRYRDLIAGAAPPPPAGSPVAVTPDGAAVSVASGSSGTQTFTVTNVGSTTATYRLTQSCSGAVVACGAPSLAEVALAPSATGNITVSYTMASSGMGALSLSAVQADASTVMDSGSYELTVPATVGEGFDLSPHNGENVDTTQFGASLTYTTPEYISMDQPQSVTLFYSSAQAVPRGLIQVDVTDATAPQQYSILLRNAAGQLLTLTNGGTENFYAGGTSGTQRLAAQFDASALPTGAHDVQVVVRRWTNGVSTESAPQWARVLVVNERSSPYGAGWSIVGLQRLHPQANGVVLTHGDGTALYFARPAGCTTPCTYQSPGGEWTTITYDGSRFVRTFRNGSRAVFDGAGFLTSVEDVFANKTQFVYDGGRLSRIVDPISATEYPQTSTITFTYATGSYAIRDAASRSVTVTLNAAGDVVKITAPDAVAAVAMQDSDYSNHRLHGWFDRLGHRWDVTYDHTGMIATTTGPWITADGTRVRPEEKVKSIAAVVLPPSYAGATSISSPAPRVAPQARISTTDARGNVSYASLDRFGNPVVLWNALSQVTTIDRDPQSSLIKSIETPAGEVVSYTYHPGTPLMASQTSKTTGKSVNFEYTTYDRPKRIWGATRETVFNYDNLYNISVEKQRSDGTWTKELVALSEDGRVMSVTDPAGHGTTYTYTASTANVWKNLSAVSGGSTVARTTKFTYDNAGRVWGTTYPGDANTPEITTYTFYDDLNRVKEFVDGLSKRTYLEYEESNGQLTSRVKDPLLNVHTSVANALGWVERHVDPRGQSRHFRYDRAGNLTEFVNRRQQTISFTYDALNRPLTRTDAARAEQTTWEYDTTADRWLRVTNAESSALIRFDAGGRPVQEEVTLAGTVYRMGSGYNHPVFETRTQFQMTSPWSRTIHYNYDSRAGLLDSIQDLSGNLTRIARDTEDGAAGLTLHRVNVRYSPTSHHVTSEVAFSNDFGLVDPDLGSGYTLDVMGRIRSRWNALRTTATTYKYDGGGRLTEIWTEDYPAAPAPCEDPDVGVCTPTNTPVTSAGMTVETDAALRTHAYSYDAAGNRTDKPNTLEPGNRLLTFDNLAMTYDADGNLLTKSASGLNQIFEWDADGQLRSVTTNGVTTTFGYDGFGRRVRKTGPGGTLRYLYNRENLFMELDGNGQILREHTFFPGVDRPLSVRQGGQTYYYLMDAPGHVVGLADSLGNAVNKYQYGAWGESLMVSEQGPSNRLRFGAREHDAETGLYHVRARYYDPTIGRFISEDPSGLAGGLNLYTYVGNDPVNRLDPTGLKELCISIEAWQQMSGDEKDAFTGEVCAPGGGSYNPRFPGALPGVSGGGRAPAGPGRRFVPGSRKTSWVDVGRRLFGSLRDPTPGGVAARIAFEVVSRPEVRACWVNGWDATLDYIENHSTGLKMIGGVVAAAGSAVGGAYALSAGLAGSTGIAAVSAGMALGASGFVAGGGVAVIAGYSAYMLGNCMNDSAAYPPASGGNTWKR